MIDVTDAARDRYLLSPRRGKEEIDMLRKLALFAGTIILGYTFPATAQDVSVLLGGRVTESDSSAGYLSVTNNFAPAGTNGFVLRGEVERTRTDFAGSESKQ